jgi:hypothetical protein
MALEVLRTIERVDRLARAEAAAASGE